MQLSAKFFPKTQYETVNGCKILYATAGNPKHTPLLVLHGARGYGSHGTDFKSFLPLADSFFLVALDMRGHGQSGLEGPITFAQISADIEQFRVQVFSGRKMVLLGGSFGGFIAQSVAVTYPDGLEALRGTAPSYHQEEDAMVNLKAKMAAGGASNASVTMMEVVFSEGITSNAHFTLIMFALSPLYSESYDPDGALASALAAQPHYLSHNALYSKGEKYFDFRAKLKVLAEKRVPVMCVVGAKDWICGVEESKEIRRCVQEGVEGEKGMEEGKGEEGWWTKVKVVEGANHSVHLEKPEVVHGLIREFLKGL